MVRDLDVTLRDEIDALYIQAQKELDAGRKDGAVALAGRAWKKLPEPKYEWDVSKSFAHALAEVLRDCGRFAQAIALMEELFASGTVKPYQDEPRFVLGTIYAEMGDTTQAKKWIGEANRISKGRCFAVKGSDRYRKYVE